VEPQIRINGIGGDALLHGSYLRKANISGETKLNGKNI